MRIGVFNRFTSTTKDVYPLGLALEPFGATYVPVDVHTIRAHVLDGPATLTLVDDHDDHMPLGDLALDAVLWRVSENRFTEYRNVLELLSLDRPVLNPPSCLLRCSDKWRTTVDLAAAGVPVVPTTLMLPGMPAPLFAGRQTVIKPCIGAAGHGVRIVIPGASLDLAEPHVAQPLIEASPETHVRVLVCGMQPVAAMHRRPALNASGEATVVNNIEAGGSPTPAKLAPVQELAATVARLFDGVLLGVDLVPWAGGFAVLEVNACPGLSGIARVAGPDVYRWAAAAILERLRRDRRC